MKYIKAFTNVESMVLERENIINDLQQFNRENKGNQKLKDEVSSNKILIVKAKEELKLLYNIRNSFYI
jgi:hypothetical protein